MRIARLLALVPGCALALLIAGCGSDKPKVIVVQQAPPPGPVVVQQPQYVEVPEAPPAVLVEAPPPSPGPGFIFIDGYWHWGGHRYEWQRGRWERPPAVGHVWVRPMYERHENVYRYTPGHWAAERHEEHH